MKPNTLALSTGVLCAAPPRFRFAGGVAPHPFYGASMNVLHSGGTSPEQTLHTTNVYNHLKLTNNITLRFTLIQPPALRPILAVRFHAGKVPAAFAWAAIDEALRRETDTQLALMARGEHVAANQRRRAMLGRYLLAHPYREQLRFFRAQTAILPAGTGKPQEAGGNAFYADIVNERHTHQERTQIERHIVVQREAPAKSAVPDAQKIADQVLERLEKRMRLDRERIGRFR